jgi:cytochrome P450
MNGTIKNDAHPTIFTEIQREKLPPRDKSSKSIYENAQMLIGAGFETTGFALSVATYHVFSNTSLYHQLKAELRPVFSQPGGIPSLTELEKLPLSKAVIQESLRMSVGVMSRLQRRNTREDMQFREWVIPKRTLVAMSQPLIHYNEDIFSEPWEFNVGRWMRGKESEELERYLVPFSKGARECVAKPWVPFLL